MKNCISLALVAVLVILAGGLAGCGGAALYEDTGDAAASSATESAAANSASASERPETTKYGILIDMTTSIPEELGSGLVSGIVNAISLSLPNLPEDISTGMPAIEAQRFYISFVDSNPLEASTLPSAQYSSDWTIPGVTELSPEPDLADPSVSYEEYDSWTDKEETYRIQYQARLDAANVMIAGLKGIDLTAIRETAMASGVLASFDKLARTMAAGDGDDNIHIIFASDLVSTAEAEIAAPPASITGSVYAIIAGYGTVETDAAITAFDEFSEPYGLDNIIPYRPEAIADCIAAWLAV